jgi:SAM-dependent MidA family methyltransferase
LRAEISRNGPITFRDFMERALYDPAAGYYTSGRARIGRRGDYFTNVSVGPLFGALIARQLAEIWTRLETPAEFVIVEQGADRGDFARDILQGLREIAPDCAAATRLVIVEPAPALQIAQRAALANEPVEWARSIAELQPFTGIHLSNELLDSFPVHLVKSDGQHWCEQWVDLRENRFVFADGPLSHPGLPARLEQIRPRPPGYLTEINLAAAEWVRDLAVRIRRGCVLAIDYGWARDEFHAPERAAGTLSAFADQARVGDPLSSPGEVDLTAHVEFTSLAEAAEMAGWRLHGFTDQHHFLVGLGQAHFPDGNVPDARALRQFKTLMHPGMLGLIFKVFALEKGLAPGRSLAGFAMAGDPRKSLGLG